jgi:hypothetical protein
MNETRVEYTGWYLGECGSCRGGFLYTIQGIPLREAGQTAAKETRTFLVGKCPLCDAKFTTQVKHS